MKIVILGGGPGGLYSGLLLKKANPTHEITVIERNPPDATFGWGIVFSDRTLASLREADYRSYKQITDHFVLWDAIDVRFRNEIIRSEGHVFAGMARKSLLQILQCRCREVGVEMKFHCEMNDLNQLPKFDLLIATDGVNSLVRRTYSQVFGSDVKIEKAKFVWLGATLPLDSFTYIFAENQHGLFQVHAYPFDGTTSTFIVECNEEVWKRSGLDQATEADTVRYCEELFADTLHGRMLLSNKSLWVSFVTVRNKIWRYENIVLLGDAAHTAHFTIGSGTKMAMEDAIALANAFDRHDNVERALNSYELERRPVVEALQRAAQDSRIYFENTQRYLHFEPMQFAFQLLTRSRITYDELRMRDPQYIDTMDRWFWKRKVKDIPCDTPALVVPTPMLTPLRLRDLTVPNRTVLSIVSPGSSVSGLPSGVHTKQLVQRAQAGAGLVMTELVAVSPQGRITPGCLGLYTDEQQHRLAAVVEEIHRSSAAKVGVQLGHAGRRGSTRPRWEGLDRPLRDGNWPLLSASPIPYSRRNQLPAELDAAAIVQVRHEFVRAAERARDAGFDLLQLHFAQGYLLASFLSPLTNQRQDRYGGALEDRLQFPLEVFDAVREVWPEDRVLAVALSATDWAKGGMVVDDAVVVAKSLKEHGCDMITVLAGQTVIEEQPYYGLGFLTSYSDQIRNEAHMPTLVGGHLTSTDQLNTIIAAGRADLCIMDLPV